jgi:hypothetical protein
MSSHKRTPGHVLREAEGGTHALAGGRVQDYSYDGIGAEGRSRGVSGCRDGWLHEQAFTDGDLGGPVERISKSGPRVGRYRDLADVCGTL